MSDAAPGAGEFELIARFFDQGTSARGDVAVGIGDDAAVVRVTAKSVIETAMFTSADGISLASTEPSRLARSAVDHVVEALHEKGATPAWTTLSLSLPAADPVWLEAFAGALLARAGATGLALVGGDTTRGPLTIVLIAHGPRQAP